MSRINSSLRSSLCSAPEANQLLSQYALHLRQYGQWEEWCMLDKKIIIDVEYCTPEKNLLLLIAIIPRSWTRLSPLLTAWACNVTLRLICRAREIPSFANIFKVFLGGLSGRKSTWEVRWSRKKTTVLGFSSSPPILRRLKFSSLCWDNLHNMMWISLQCRIQCSCKQWESTLLFKLSIVITLIILW